ncbi:DUF2231 domain-containing protein [Ciceribacter thiooxidans]|uniref:DUF2231 domain-containing protein n=1 Tax=Ciceribacter thiooxidans TaxID=1969821 RepID=A0ABV7I9U9_9HYPH|nr:DUF2231 domain-containing protein [Ciceribacter thiooxidans]MDI6837316.1 DUF2231 domain-containing protein [Rhizobiaceae bacterium]
MTPIPGSPRAMMATMPVHSLLVPFPLVCFTLALLTDITYWQTAHLMWQNFSDWLLFAGITMGVIAGVVGAVEFFVRPHGHAPGIIWLHIVGYLLVLALAFANNLVHAADGWPAVVPYGLVLSAATVILMFLLAILGRIRLYRTYVGVEDYD